MTSLSATSLVLVSSPDRFDAREEVHLWYSWIDQDESRAASFTLLDDDERARADRYRFRRDRDRFVARHAFVRCVLARYLGVAPTTIAFRTTGRGRVELDTASGISFNTSHSDGLAVVAVARGRRVGVDIERVRHLDDVMGVAAGLMTEREMGSIRSAPGGSRSRAFLTLWTRKESFVKAVGAGLSMPLDGFDMSSVGEDGVGRPRGRFGDLPFAFTGLEVPEGYIGTVTVEGTRVALRSMSPEGSPRDP